MTVQFIELEGKPTFAVVPIGEWNAMQARMEELQDIADAKAARETEYLPAEFVTRLLDGGDHPLRVWRNFRGYSLEELARRCGVSRQMLSMIENGKANPSTELLAKLAGTLDCDMDDLHR